MYIVQVGHRHLNMDFLVQADDAELEPAPKQLPDGVVRVTMALGRPFDLMGVHAATMRRVLAELAVKPESCHQDSQAPPRTRGARKVERSPSGDPQSVPTRE